jgi:phosphatidylethanolamine/phosphatidyl-N-methylethanolamine N-methyltransferase
VYDQVFGAGLQPGRARALTCLPLRQGDAVLEVGIGTGLTADLYPDGCVVTGIDVSSKMLDLAARRIAQRGLRHVRLLQMDAAAMAFPDETFALTCAAYVLTAVPDPSAVAREMRRVCKPGGYIVFLNHFMSDHPLLSWCERVLSPVTERVGFRTDLSLSSLLHDTGLTPVRVERVNVSGLWSLVICRKCET